MQFTRQQIEFLSDMKSEQLAFVAGFGAGKTFAGCYKGLGLACANPNTAGMMVSPTFPMLRDTTRRTFLQILEQENISFDFKATENKITIIEPNSEVWFRSADDPDRLKGSNLAWCGLDEAAQMEEEAYIIALSRIREPKARIRQLFITTTPEGYNWLYEKQEKLKLVNASTEDNPYIPESYVKMLYENYDAQLIEQYLHGKFVLLNKGQVYYAFDRTQNVKEQKYNPDLPIILCVDFNINPSCYAIVQHYPNADYVVDEIVLKNSNTETASRKVREKYPKAQIFVYGDYSGSQRHTSSSTTDFEIIKNIINPVDIRIKPNPPVIDRVNAVNSRLCNAKGERRLFVSPVCKTVIKDFEQVTYKEGKREIDKSNLDLTHISDALGYYIEYEYSLKGKPQVSHRFGV